jgi:hypothetical protein
VVVVERNVDNLRLPLQQHTGVHGVVRFEGTSPPPDPTELIELRLKRTDGTVGEVPPMQVLGGRTFRSIPLTPGEYLLGGGFRTEAFGAHAVWRLKSAIVAGGADMSDMPVNLGAKEVGEIVVTFTDIVPGRIDGRVTKEAGGPDAEASVVLFPTDKRYWSHYAPVRGVPDPVGRVQIALSSRLGAYSLPSVPAGDYFLVAVPDADEVWAVIVWAQDPDLLAKLSGRANRITVKDGGNIVQDLRTMK